MTQTNAQAALQAAATLHSGSAGHANTTSVLKKATEFKEWLGRQEPATLASPGGEPAKVDRGKMLVEAVVKAWTDAGSHPIHHNRAKQQLLQGWPALANAVDALADYEEAHETEFIHHITCATRKGRLDCDCQPYPAQ